ncbi:hypothetical protein JCM8547_004258 [Rhodosporidiobolus lusitaniae]
MDSFHHRTNAFDFSIVPSNDSNNSTSTARDAAGLPSWPDSPFPSSLSNFAVPSSSSSQQPFFSSFQSAGYPPPPAADVQQQSLPSFLQPAPHQLRHRRSSSIHSLSSVFSSDSEASPLPSHATLEPSSSVVRRTPAYRSARESPYSRCGSSSSSSVAGDGGQDEEEVKSLGLEDGFSRMLFTVSPTSTSDAAEQASVLFGVEGALTAEPDVEVAAAEVQKAQEVERRLEKAAAAVHAATTATATDKARSAFVQTWLTHSYELAEGSTVARQALYGSYAKASETHQVKPLNSASFGKAVRQAFPTLKTRRLGTRGHSRYHLMNFRPSNSIEAALLARIDEESKAQQAQAKEHGGEEGGSSVSSASSEGIGAEEVGGMGGGEEEEGDGVRSSRRTSNRHSLSISIPPGDALFDEQKTLLGSLAAVPTATATAMATLTSTATAMPGLMLIPQLPQHPPLPPEPVQLPQAFPSLDELVRQAGEGGLLLRTLWDELRGYCGELLRMAKEGNFGSIEQQVFTWWRNRSTVDITLLQHPVIVSLVCRAQALVYEEILLSLHASPEGALSPESLLALGSLADNMEALMSAALAFFTDQAFILPNVELACRFGHILNHHLDLRKLVQALQGIFAKPNVENELAQAWNEVDFASIQKQAALACHLDVSLLDTALSEFGSFLASTRPLTVLSLIAFLESKWALHADEVPSPRGVLLKVGWVAGEVMRDLTLRDVLTFRILLQTALHVDSSLPLPVAPPPAPPSLPSGFTLASSPPQPTLSLPQPPQRFPPFLPPPQPQHPPPLPLLPPLPHPPPPPPQLLPHASFLEPFPIAPSALVQGTAMGTGMGMAPFPSPSGGFFFSGEGG